MFTTAISHIAAWSILFSVAAVGNTCRPGGWLELHKGVCAVPNKFAFFGGFGWTSTLVMVAASPVIGVALTQVLVVSGELLTAALVDACLHSSARWARTATGVSFVIVGIAVSVRDEVHSGSGVNWLQMLRWTAAAFGCGSCLVLNSLGNTHTRKHIGAANASAWSAAVASCGNVAIWVAVEAFGMAHFHADSSSTTLALWVIVSSASAWMVFVVTFVPERIGFALTFCLIVAGKMSGGLFVDAIGLSRKVRPVTWKRIAGVAFVFVAALVLKETHGVEETPAYANLEGIVGKVSPGGTAGVIRPTPEIPRAAVIGGSSKL